MENRADFLCRMNPVNQSGCSATGSDRFVSATGASVSSGFSAIVPSCSRILAWCIKSL